MSDVPHKRERLVADLKLCEKRIADLERVYLASSRRSEFGSALSGYKTNHSMIAAAHVEKLLQPIFSQSSVSTPGLLLLASSSEGEDDA